MKNFKSIAERNAEFATMTINQKRVALAKDVLAQIEMRRFEAMPGTYMSSTLQDEDGGYVLDSNGYTQAGETCRVCALGALTVSLLDGDAFTPGGNSAVGCYEALGPLWPYKDASEIESAFENYKNPAPDAEGRLKEIMLNIITNEGEFDKSQLSWKLWE